MLSVAGLVLAWGLPQLGLPSLLADGKSLAAALAREAVWWSIGAFMLLWIVYAEKLPLSSIGIKRPSAGTFVWGFLFAILMIASVMLCYAVLFPVFGLELNQQVVASITRTPLRLQCAVMLRAGFVEEILYRGYAIERLQALTGSKWLAGVVSAAVFILMHLAGWGGAQLIVVTFGAVLLTILYMWRRDLPCAMLAHALTNLVGFGLARLQS